MHKGVLQALAVLVVIAGFGAASIYGRRRTLRPWLLWLPLTVVVLIVPIALPLIQDLRNWGGGESAAWGRLGEMIILLGLIPIFSVAGGALVALLVLLPRYGFASQEAVRAARTESWHQRMFRPRTAEETNTRLLVSLGSIIVVGVLWLLGVRPG